MIFKFCPICGSRSQLKDIHGQNLPVCQNNACGFKFWQNPKPCACVIIMNAQEEILMTVRAEDPDIGKLDLPGGFLNEAEHPYDAAVREAKEELGIQIAVQDVVGFAIDDYSYEGVTGKTLNIGLKCQIIKGSPQPVSEISAVEWVDPWNYDGQRLAFTNNEKFLLMMRK